MCRETDPNALAAKILAQLAGGLGGATGEAVRSFFASVGSPICAIHFDEALRLLAREGKIVSADSSAPIPSALDPEELRGLGLAPSVAPGPAPAPMVSSSPTRILGGRWRVFLEAVLGRGSSAMVYRAEHIQMGKAVAVKILRPDFSCLDASPQEIQSRFEREGRIMGSLRHINIVQAFDCGQDGGEYWYVMELVEGGATLAMKIAAGSIPPARLAQWMLDVATGLEAASKPGKDPQGNDHNGIVHRDVKPSNILIDADGRARIMDFGLAKILPHPGEAKNRAEQTKKIGLMGSLPYMASEICNFEPATHASDRYSLGATFYEAATGEYLFAIGEPNGENTWEWIDSHVAGQPRLLRSLRPDFPEDFAGLIHWTLAKKPEERPTYAKLVAELKRIVRRLHPPTTAAGVPAAPAAPPPPASTVSGASNVARELSLLVGALEVQVLTAKTRLEERFGVDEARSKNLGFLNALYVLAKEKGALRAFELVHARKTGAAAVPDFDSLYLERLSELAAGTEPSDPETAVPLDVMEYLHLAAAQVAEQKAQGAIPDTTAAEILLKFVEEAADAPALAEFRIPEPAAVPQAAATAAGPVTAHSKTVELPPPPKSTTGPRPATSSSVQKDRRGQALENGKFVIDSFLGRGGMGEVWKARDTSLDREVAIKIIEQGEWTLPEKVDRFIREMKLAATLDAHPNIVQAYTAGREGALLYFVMELVRGDTFQDVLAESGPIEERKALRFARQVLEALAVAHRHGLIHRDIKPENIMVENQTGRVLVMDFGLMRSFKKSEKDVTLTTSGVILGTPAYASPEQLKGEPAGVDARTDLYSLGATLYELLTGYRPFTGKTLTQLITQVMTEEPKPIRERRPEIRPEVADLVHQLLAKKPDKRPANAEEVIRRIDLLLAPPPRRSRAPAFIAAALVLAVAAIGIVAAARPKAAGPARPDPQPSFDLGRKEIGGDHHRPDPKQTHRGMADRIGREVAIPKAEDSKTGDSPVELAADVFPPSIVTVDPDSRFPFVRELSGRRIGDTLSPDPRDTLLEYVRTYVSTAAETDLVRTIRAAIAAGEPDLQARKYGAVVAELERIRKRPDGTSYTAWILDETIALLLDLTHSEGARKGAAEDVYYAALPPSAQLAYHAVHGDPMRAAEILLSALDPASDVFEPGTLGRLPALLQGLVLRAIAHLERGDDAAAAETRDRLTRVAALVPAPLRYAFEPTGDLAYEIEAAAALRRKDLETLFVKFEKSRAARVAAVEKLKAFHAILLEDELVDEVEFIAWKRDLADASGGKITLERNPERYRFITATNAQRAWIMKKFDGAKEGYEIRWRFDSTEENRFVVSLLARDNPDRKRWIEVAAGAATLYRSDRGTTEAVAVAELPAATRGGTLSVVPAAGVNLIFIQDRLLFALPSGDYPLDEGLRLGAGGAVTIESIRVINRD